jgi:FMN phosphatase YigB (HAD superfamily)
VIKVRDAVIVDVDGTLCDVRGIRHLIGEKGFDAFHRASASCPPHPGVVEVVRAADAAGLAVLVVTGRVERWRRLTSMWLALHEVPSDVLEMRRDLDYRMDYVIKREILARLRSRYRIVHAWDDNPAILRLWAEEGIPATVVPGWDDPV